VMSILRQTYCVPKFLYYLLPGAERRTRREDGSFERQVMIADADEFRARWQDAVKSLEYAIARLRHPHEFGVTKSSYLPYVSILPVFAAALAEVGSQSADNRLAAEGRFRLWYWASIFTNRYSGSTETTAARDIQDLRAWFADPDVEPAIVQQFRSLIPALDLRSQVRKGDSSYNAIFNLAVIAGARDWITGAIPQADELNDHHIVPKSWGLKNIEGNSIDTILNRTPLTDYTNQHVISDRLPNSYLSELIAKNGRDQVEQMMQSHFISGAALDVLLRDPFTPDDFEEFIRERQRTIGSAIQSLLIGGRADLSPDLRALDEEVERIELALRALIVERLSDSLEALPHHIRPKIDQRIARELKKNPAAEATYYASLRGALEFADLMELMDVFTAKGMEAHFESIFPTKESLATKFVQLGDLRNGIRHSRRLGDIARKEGEAAILWFDAALKRAREADQATQPA